MNFLKFLWEARYALSIPLVLAALACSFIFSSGSYLLYAAAWITFLVGVAILNQPRIRREREQQKASVDAAFQNAYAELIPQPHLVSSTSYGYPAFEIKFPSKVALEAAASRNAVFKAEIAKIFERVGSCLNAFDAEKAIFFTYDGYLEELRARSSSSRIHAERPSSTVV